jgi:hypothetical protein
VAIGVLGLKYYTKEIIKKLIGLAQVELTYAHPM